MSPKRLSIFDIATMYEGEQDSATAVLLFFDEEEY